MNLLIRNALLALAFALAVAQAMTGDPRDQKINAVFRYITHDAPGAAALVIRSGQVSFEHGYGVTDLRSETMIGPVTNFRLASVSKQFTAMAIMLLVHDGRLRYDQKLTDLFPAFPAYGKTITIRNLLNHTSGLLDYEDLMGPEYTEERQIQDEEVLALLEKQDHTRFVPGSRWEYSNSGYVVLGTVVAKVSGVPFRQFLHDRIFAPLHMDGTVAYQRGKNEVMNRAFGHTLENGNWKQTDQSSTSATLGDGGIYSSLNDLAKWDRALREHALLGEGEMRAALTPVPLPDASALSPEGKPAQYGFGWFLDPYRGHERMWHYGETVGFRSAIERFPKDQLTVIVLANRTDEDAWKLALKIADLFF
jgi:CubicO group peptidase (beta-lactamase class C family)